jgi:hypothetical protein
LSRDALHKKSGSLRNVEDLYLKDPYRVDGEDQSIDATPETLADNEQLLTQCSTLLNLSTSVTRAEDINRNNCSKPSVYTAIKYQDELVRSGMKKETEGFLLFMVL